MNSLNLLSPFLEYTHDGLLLIVGALIGFLSSTQMWKRQVAYEGKKRRGEHILRAIQLAVETTTYTRCLLYSKTEGIASVLNLPSNPVDELIALTELLPEIKELVQKLHDKQQELFAYDKRHDSAATAMFALAEGIVSCVNEISGRLRNSMRGNQ